mgnify:FL=1
MKRRMIWILLAGVLVGLTLSGLYKHFVTDQIMDRGGMENPDVAFPLDGDRTYVDNAVLWSVLAGTWASADGRWQASIREDNGIVLSLDGETVLRAPLYFTYLQPGQIIWTEITLENCTLVTPDGVSRGVSKSFGHEAENGEPSGTLEQNLERPDDSEETVTFRKTQE